MKKSAHKYSFLEAKQKIEAWCAYRERCHFEVTTKLKEFSLDKEDVDNLLAHLIQERFVNEQRFADAFVSGKYRIKKWGRNKIIQQLKLKHVPESCILSALKTEIDFDEYKNNLFQLATRKWNEKSGDLIQKRLKVAQFLYNKGYEYELIQEVLDEILN